MSKKVKITVLKYQSKTADTN